MTLSITTLGIKFGYAERRIANCLMFFTESPIVIKPSVVMPNVVAPPRFCVCQNLYFVRTEVKLLRYQVTLSKVHFFTMVRYHHSNQDIF
jgi:hypothetical protein